MQYTGLANGFDVQQQVRNCIEDLFPEVEKVLNAFDLDGQLISIDQLELNISLQGSHWQQELVKQVGDSMAEKLKGMVSQVKPGESTHILPVSLSIESSFLFFLRHGYFPWNFQSRQVDEWRVEIKQVFKRETSPGFFEGLMSALKEHRECRKRIVCEIGFPEFFNFVKSNSVKLSPTVKELTLDIELFIKILGRYFFPINEDEEIGHSLVAAFSGDPSARAESIERLSAVLLKWNAARRRKIRKNENPMIAAFLKESFQSDIFSSAQRQVHFEITGRQTIEEHEAVAAPDDGTLTSAEDNNLIHGKALGSLERSDSHDDKSIFISNAGLIILAPFFPMLFKNLGLWNGEVLSKQSMAACIAGFIYSGQAVIHESELVLPKVLCGLEPESLVETGNFNPGEEIKNEADALIKSAIEYWSVLKNTSVEGFRDSFLVREGKLEKKDDDWLLRVEQRPYDILLQQLPWNISMIRLPWMKCMVMTEWVG